MRSSFARGADDGNSTTTIIIIIVAGVVGLFFAVLFLSIVLFGRCKRRSEALPSSPVASAEVGVQMVQMTQPVATA